MTNISGFPEFLPKEQIAFNKVIEKIKEQFELYGFIPLDTPAVERVATLLAKGNDSEIYGLHRLAGDEGAKEKALALRFDLTVPLARYVAQHYGQITFPYRRYHIAPVWRGERPQAGRYRQFYQCDIDVVSVGELPLIYDAETLSIIYNVFKAIGVERFIIKINNRFLLTGMIKSFGVLESSVDLVMRTIDKAEKISKDALDNELRNYGISQINTEVLSGLIAKRLTNKEWIEYLESIGSNEEFFKGVEELKKVMKFLKDFGVQDQYIQIDPTLARGLNYYTGTVSETRLVDFPELGSVCGGGRYENLVGSFSNKRFPGVGFSIGVSRLIPKLIEFGVIHANQETTATVLVSVQDPALVPFYIKIAKTFRIKGVNTEIYLSKASLAVQMKYADKKGFKFIIIANQLELEKQQIILKRLSDGKQTLVTINQAIEIIKGA
ncbi:histidine--tRNA ligase [Holospora undulata]|uniref:histidine--tRNA ligase n=1 Tax=Holospora undulata TaxID=1169117 RepID=UPI001F011B03|nr:histidine--tRNA ligase [Holospora undulata]